MAGGRLTQSPVMGSFVPAEARIDLGALRANVAALREHAGVALVEEALGGVGVAP